jgi:hypothetical protein
MNMHFAVDDDLDKQPTLDKEAFELFSPGESRPEIAVGDLSVAILHRLTLILIVAAFPAK